jgi:hypothetical protein
LRSDGFGNAKWLLKIPPASAKKDRESLACTSIRTSIRLRLPCNIPG